MISIVTAYYNRKELFIRTLKSIQDNSEGIEYEVIAVDDGSDPHERLEDIIPIFPFLRIIRLEKENKWYYNSCIPFNKGFSEVQGHITIIQNPECLHFEPILPYVEKKIKKNEYISFGCFSLGIDNTNNIDNLSEDELNQIINNNTLGYVGDGLDCWYNHPKYRPAGYHFCTALYTKDLIDMGGFDERYALGVAYDDNEFLHRVKKKKMKIKITKSPIVIHQNHYNKPSNYNNLSLMDEKKQEERNRLVERNKCLYELVTVFNNSYRANFLDNKKFTQTLPKIKKWMKLKNRIENSIKHRLKK